MKKSLIVLLVFITAMLSGCGGANESSNSEPEESTTSHNVIKELSEEEIRANLSESDDFWLLVSPQQFENPAQAYTLKNVDILSHETTREYEEFIVTADAESPFAVYSGSFIVKYTGNKKDGYTLNMVGQDYVGTYEITALPTGEIAEEWFMRPTFIPPSCATYQKGKLLSASVHEIKDRNFLCEVQYDHLSQIDEHCNVKERLSCYCKFENGIWNVTDQLFREPEINYIYDLPPVSSQEIADAIASIVPECIGSYDMSSGTIAVDDTDAFLTHVSGCTITSENFDATQFVLDLELRCQKGGNYQWLLENASTDGYLSFKTSSELLLYDWTNEASILIKISSLVYDAETERYIASVITTDETPRRGSIPPGEAVERNMELVSIESESGLPYRYFLRDNTYYVYLDEDCMPQSFAYTD